MRTAILLFALAASAAAYDVSIVGRPYLQTMLMPSIEFSGESMQLTVKVRVLDDDGKPASEAVLKTCFSCHEPGKDRDFVFTHYAP